MSLSNNDFQNRMFCPGCNTLPTVLLARVRDFEYNSSAITYNYYQCSTCKNVVLESHLSDNELRAAYPEDYYSFHLAKNYKRYLSSAEGKKFYNSWTENLKNWAQGLSENLKKPISECTILDYGSGDDFFLHLLEKAGFTVNNLFFYDKFNYNKDLPRFFNPEIKKNKVKTFDVIFANHVIEHMRNPVDLFDFSSVHLKKGGILIVETPVPGGLQFALTKNSIWGGYHAPRHLLLMRPETISKIAQAFDFSLREKTFLDDSWIWLQTLNNLIKTNNIAYLVLRPLQSGFVTGSKEQPTALRRYLLGFLSGLSKTLKKFGHETSIVKMVFTK